MKTLSTVADYNNYFNLGAPMHPLMDVKNYRLALPKFPNEINEIQVNLFKVLIKKNFQVASYYGKTSYFTSNWIMLFMEPGQMLSRQAIEFWDGYCLVFHPELIKNHPLAKKISDYDFFNYGINGALLLTEREEKVIPTLFEGIYEELLLNGEQTNTDVFIAFLNVILSYSKEFYKRQFKTTSIVNNSLIDKVRTYLKHYYSDLSKPVLKTPTVKNIADELKVTPNHLCDLVKKGTGMSTIELIHEFIIERAEILLTQTDLTISEISCLLGFENPAYFSRLIRSKTAKTPSEIKLQRKV